MFYITQKHSNVLGATACLEEAISNLHEIAFSYRAAVNEVQVLQTIMQGGVVISNPHEKDVGYLYRHLIMLSRMSALEIENTHSGYDSSSKNPVILPYPTQLLPLVAFEKELELEGFELIERGGC